jgi:hypothetical protein
MRTLGFDIVRASKLRGKNDRDISDLSREDQAIVALAKPFTMTTVEKMAALVNSIDHLTINEVPGNIAECGVWRGGSMMIVALSLLARGDTSRSLFLYDTFEGMTAPTDKDKLRDGTTATAVLNRHSPGTGNWCCASLDEVRGNVLSTGYPSDKIHFIKGKVEDTIPGTLPGRLALLRLDTDWYESTKHELNHLFPLLDDRGVFILDDYASWQGAKAALDEYVKEHQLKVYLHRVDAYCRVMVKRGF